MKNKNEHKALLEGNITDRALLIPNKKTTDMYRITTNSLEEAEEKYSKIHSGHKILVCYKNWILQVVKSSAENSEEGEECGDVVKLEGQAEEELKYKKEYEM
jgi:hypothetical protein